MLSCLLGQPSESLSAGVSSGPTILLLLLLLWWIKRVDIFIPIKWIHYHTIGYSSFVCTFGFNSEFNEIAFVGHHWTGTPRVNGCCLTDSSSYSAVPANWWSSVIDVPLHVGAGPCEGCLVVVGFTFDIISVCKVLGLINKKNMLMVMV